MRGAEFKGGLDSGRFTEFCEISTISPSYLQIDKKSLHNHRFFP
jgi:hypothetical protein